MANPYRKPRVPPPPAPYEGPPPLPFDYVSDEVYVAELFSFLVPAAEMKRYGYVVNPLSHTDIQYKAKCKNCNQSILNLTRNLQKTLKYREDHPIPPPPKIRHDPLPMLRIPLRNGYFEAKQCTVPCNYHPGDFIHGAKCFTCCGKTLAESKWCFTSNAHEIIDYGQRGLEDYYQFHKTPSTFNAGGLSPRSIVAIDCEMGTAVTGDSELIRLTAIDYFSGEVLINNLVQPDQPMLHLNTRFSGVTFPQLNKARKERTCLMGKAGARDALWRFVGPRTALLGHGVNNDLRALRWIHPFVIDSFVIESKSIQAKKAAEEAAAATVYQDAEQQIEDLATTLENASIEDEDQGGVLLPKELLEELGETVEAQPKKKEKKPKGSGDLSLKMMMKKYLDKDIQTQGNKGHDSFEDTLAARELVHWMALRNIAERKGKAA